MRIAIVGGGYTGFYTAWKLEKKLRPNEVHVTLIDPQPTHIVSAYPVVERDRRKSFKI